MRIESITKISDGSLRSLDLKSDMVRKALAGFSGSEVAGLYESEVSLPFV